MKKLLFIVIGIILFPFCKAQDTSLDSDKVLRIMLFNPGIEVELPIFNTSTFTANMGVGFEGAYKNLAVTPSEPYYNYYVIAPFLDLRYKNIYNKKRRNDKGLNTSYNSGNYWGARFLYRSQSLYSNFARIDNMDFSFGPVWGLQRSYNKFYFQFEVGPMYYFDTKGNSGIFPLMLDVNIGYNISRF